MSDKNESVLEFKAWLQAQERESRYCILVYADPDALASAMALRRLLRQRVTSIDICFINAVTRPDNLAMIRYLRIPAQQWQAQTASNYDHFALLDSQPTHHALLREQIYSLVIDHHPQDNWEDNKTPGCFCHIAKNIGATSTIMARYLKTLSVRPGPLLATALLYGIRTDTAAFERSGSQDDLKAYHWLFKYANAGLLRRICRSEYLRAWLPLFSRAFRSLKDCRGNGAHASLNVVGNADLLVCIADFFTKVHGLRWIAVSGIVDKNVIVIFRGDGILDMGQMAQDCFASLGQGGGHRTLARAEFPLAVIPQECKSAEFVYQKLQKKRTRNGNSSDHTAGETENYK